MDMTDSYAGQKATLRDNVKWLATSFAGTAALLLAGTPFTDFGALQFPSWRLGVASASLFVATISAFLAWNKLLWVLRPDITYNRFLKDPWTKHDEETLKADPDERLEYEALRKEFLKHKVALLGEIESIEALEEEKKKAWDSYTAAAAKKANGKADVDPGPWHSLWESYNRNILIVNSWLGFTRLHQRVTREMKTVRIYAIVVLVSLALFAYFVSPGESSETNTSPGTVMVDQSYSGAELRDLPQLESVTFATGEHVLDDAGRTAVGNARDHLRAAPELGLLLVAHTDTVGNEAFNVALAAKRAQAVKKALIKAGGIAPARVYIAELPESDLPIITDQEVNEAANRSVELLAFRLPKR